MDGDADRDLRPVLLLRFTRGQLIGIDAAVTLTWLLLTMATTRVRAAELRYEMPWWLQMLLMAAVILPVAARRLWPRAVFTVTLVMALVAVWLGPIGEVFLAPAFALYLVATTVSRRSWEPTFAIGGVSVIGTAILISVGTTGTQDHIVGALLLGIMLMGAAWTIGRAVRERRLYVARSAEQRAGQAVVDERLRIARELHDIVAHSMSLIAVKAGIANHVLAVRPDEAHDALRVIETTSRDALIEMRHLLGVLRTEPSRDGQADLGPTPGLAGLPELVDRAAMAGVEVTLAVSGDTELPEGVGLAVFRIVQEAVTNVVKHAAPARCQVTVTATKAEVRVSVTDDGGARGPANGHRMQRSNPGGHGLVGIRERVALYCGTFRAGPRPEGGFGVAAHLPYGSSRATPAEVSGGVP